ncbi:amidohydrolase, partial [Rhizobiaceae sp. 2RAB30]
MIVDAHHHLWQLARGDYHWMPGAPEILLQDYMPEDMAPLLRRFGVARTIVVQAAQTRAETDFLLELAAGTDFIAGVVGWLDMENEAFA